MKRVIGYVRVSTELQKDKDNSVRNQIEKIEDYCRNGGFELMNVYRDEGVSGLKQKRDGLDKMLMSISKKDVDIVLVYSLSRLGRKLVDVISWVNQLERMNIEFHSIKENFGNGGVIGKLMRNILGSINEFEVGVLSERIRDVKQFKKSKMEVYGGKTCYGWDRVEDRLVVNQDEYEVLENIEHLRMNGWSYGRIANYLNSRNVLSKQGGKWYSSSVRSVFGNGVLRKSEYINVPD